MEHESESRAMSWPRRMLGWLMLLGIIAVAIGVGFYFNNPFPAEPSIEPVTPGNLVAGGIVLGVLGVLSLIFSGVLYVVMYATQCLTFSYSRPVWQGYNVRRWFANIVVGLGLCGGVALIMGAVLTPLLTLSGFSDAFALMLGIMLPFVLLQLLISAVDMWMPLVRPLMVKRLRAMGMPPGAEAGGLLVGQSNPDNKSDAARFVQPLSDTIGYLWLTKDGLHYIGDTGRFSIPRDQVTAIQRNASGASWASYFGGRDVIVACRSADGAHQYRIRLHPYDGGMTMPAHVRTMDKLATKLKDWLAADPEVEPGGPVEQSAETAVVSE